jgi:sugar O-acyltransferase (sialic acid O-acetyltransferase NeuD family)
VSKEREWIVYGVGGFGREVEWLIRRRGERVVSFVSDDATRVEHLHGVPVSGDIGNCLHDYPNSVVAIAVADSVTRARLADRVIGLGGRCPVLIDPTAECDADSVQIGEGTIVCARSVLTVDIAIGRFVQINLGCTVGHDAVVKDYVTLAPGVHVSGRVVIQQGAMLGTGAVMIQGRPGAPLIVGEDSVVGAQACVIRPVPDHVTAVGVPAKPAHATPKH